VQLGFSESRQQEITSLGFSNILLFACRFVRRKPQQWGKFAYRVGLIFFVTFLYQDKKVKKKKILVYALSVLL